MLTWLEELTRPASWREAEEAVMQFYAGLLAGRIPELPDGASSVLLRRLGYLLEMAALRSETPQADRLSAATRNVRARLDAVAEPARKPAALIGEPRPGSRCQDEVAERWGLAAGLDLSRFDAYCASSPRRVVGDDPAVRDRAGAFESKSTAGGKMIRGRWFATVCPFLLALVVGCDAPPGEQGGHPWAWWVEILRDPDPAERERAVGVLRGWPGNPTAAILPLVYASCDPDGYVRAAALESVAPQVRVGPELIAVLERGLLDAHPDVRIAAAKGLEGLGAAAAPAMPLLEVAGLDVDRKVSWAAIRAIAATGEQARPTLLRWLGSQEEREIYAGLRLCDRLSEPVAQAVPLVGRLLDDPRPRVSGWAAGYCQKLGSGGIEFLSKLISACADGDLSTRAVVWSLAEALGKDATPVLLEHADRAEPHSRRVALWCLMRTPELRAEAVDRLRLAARDPEAEVRATLLLRANHEIGRARKRREAGEAEATSEREWDWLIVPAEECMTDPDEEVRKWAKCVVHQLRPSSAADEARLAQSASCSDRERVRFLAAVGSEASLADVLYWLRNGSPDVRVAAAGALADQVHPGEEGAGLLARALEDEDARVRCVAARALGERFEKGRFGRALLGLVRDEDPRVRRQAVVTLVRQRPDGAEPLIEILTTALRDSDPDVRRSGAWGLRQLGPPARDAGKDLAMALQDADSEVRSMAMHALESLEVRVPDAVPGLLERMRDPSLIVRSNAMSALGRVGSPGAEVLRAIRGALTDPMDSVALDVPATLAALGSEALPELLEVASHGDSGVRERAMAALGALANPSREIYDTLLRGLRDPKEDVRAAAVRALRRHLDRDASVRLGLERALRDRRSSVRSAARAVLDGWGGTRKPR